MSFHEDVPYWTVRGKEDLSVGFCELTIVTTILVFILHCCHGKLSLIELHRKGVGDVSTLECTEVGTDKLIPVGLVSSEMYF